MGFLIDIFFGSLSAIFKLSSYLILSLFPFVVLFFVFGFHKKVKNKLKIFET